MKYSSRAIALSYIKHGESSIIAKIFTEEKGLQSFIIKGVRNKKSKKKTRSISGATIVKHKRNLSLQKKPTILNRY